jgi:hypothetical protein
MTALPAPVEQDEMARRERCKAFLSKLQRDAMLRQGSPVDDLLAFIAAERVAFAGTAIIHMVNRFLAWSLPEDFNPDAGISFKRTHSEDAPWGVQKYEPMGTNLFDYAQATAMVRHMLEGLPSQEDAL